jgi:hypothetical protein
MGGCLPVFLSNLSSSLSKLNFYSTGSGIHQRFLTRVETGKGPRLTAFFFSCVLTWSRYALPCHRLYLGLSGSHCGPAAQPHPSICLYLFFPSLYIYAFISSRENQSVYKGSHASYEFLNNFIKFTYRFYYLKEYIHEIELCFNE